MRLLILIVLLPLLGFAQPPETIENSIDMTLVLIPAGEFQMGSSRDDELRQPDEKPHPVTLTTPFYLSATELTQAQWQAVMGHNRSAHQGDNLPAEKMSWKEAVRFCEKLSEIEGVIYRLPTEVEWEYACRAGSSGPFAGDLNTMGWYAMNSGGETHPVAQKQPNAWGLYDMHGNVSEWCLDFYQPDYPDAATDPVGPDSGRVKVIRGGSFATFLPGCRCAARQSGPAAYKYVETGFRVVRELD